MSQRVSMLVVALWAFLSAAASAGDWQITPRLSLSETYTDNVRFAEEGARGDFITMITPGISLRGKSARLQTNVDYNLQQVLYGHVTDFNATNHQLQSNANAIIIEDWVFFDTRGQMSQQTVDNRNFFTRDNRGPDDNRRDVTSYEFSPSIRHAFGSWVNLDASYSNQTVDQSGSSDSTSFVNQNGGDQEAFQFNLASGRRFTRTPVSVFARRNESAFESGQTSVLESYGGQGSYVFNRKFRFNVTGGQDNNSFQTNQNNQSGPYWTVGGTWTPSERTSLTGAWGQRFFGDTFNISGNHRHRRWSVNGTYTETVETAFDFERQLVLIPLVDAQGLPVFDPVTSSQIFIPIDTPSSTDDVFVSKQATAGLSYELRRGNVGVTYFQADRAFQAGGFNELTRGASVNFNWRLSSRLGWAFTTYFRENTRSDDTNTDSSAYGISPSLNYQLGPHTTALLRFEHNRNEGGGVGGLAGPGGTFTENVLTANLVFNL